MLEFFLMHHNFIIRQTHKSLLFLNFVLILFKTVQLPPKFLSFRQIVDSRYLYRLIILLLADGEHFEVGFGLFSFSQCLEKTDLFLLYFINIFLMSLYFTLLLLLLLHNYLLIEPLVFNFYPCLGFQEILVSQLFELRIGLPEQAAPVFIVGGPSSIG